MIAAQSSTSMILGDTLRGTMTDDTLLASLLVAALLLFSASQSSSDQPYELKGEAPGITLKQFKSNHKHADCMKQSETLVHCHVWNDVSFSGVAAKTFKGCPLPECTYQGIFADFI